ncbi:MAG: hypothetical protein K2X66_14855, partial [Cyanobacteria bacterium]|nr:hypothetical protein [Cyanobacteriota bacterium]
MNHLGNLSWNVMFQPKKEHKDPNISFTGSKKRSNPTPINPQTGFLSESLLGHPLLPKADSFVSQTKSPSATLQPDRSFGTELLTFQKSTEKPPLTPQEQFFKAVRMGKSPEIQTALKQGINPNCKDSDGQTAV